jgi:glycogen debranching enzyme
MVSERIRIGDEYYLLASALAPRRSQQLLNHGDSFAIFDLAGDIPLAGRELYGLFHAGTRFLDRFELRLNGEFPILLSSAANDDGSEIVTYLSNADEHRDGELVLVRDTLAIQRSKALHANALYECLHLQNYGQEPLTLQLSVLFGSDFADVFTLRGVERKRSGAFSVPVAETQTARLTYTGLDGIVRQTEIAFAPAEWRVDTASATLDVRLEPGQDGIAEICVSCRTGDAALVQHNFATAAAAVRAERRAWHDQLPVLYSNNEGFNDWMNRSLHDLALLRSDGAWGPYVYAGIPWFATVFGRDGIITALETLAFAPDLAADVLRALAATQGKTSDPDRDEEAGKIVHELRLGEMAATGEVPFGRYYGSVDATPLFLMLLAAYHERTADLDLVCELWPAAVAAMGWIDAADRDGDGYVDYARRTTRGLVNQGWKDSHDAVMHKNGSLAEPPIALAEVQAYVYAARRDLAQLARRLDRPSDAAAWEAKADRLRQRFNRDFWVREEETFALALDGTRQPCRVVASNAAHCLFGGIADPDKARGVIDRLMRSDVFCGWGLRTLSAYERRYNPMSYHNGSVWPHDNALAAAGFARYGATDRAAQLLTALFDASLATEDRSLPELFCGFARHEQRKPVPYPVACKPQAWAAGSVFLLLQTTLGLHIDAVERRVTLQGSALPGWLQRLDIRGLRVRNARLDLSIARGAWGVAVEVIDKEGEVEVVVRK